MIVRVWLDDTVTINANMTTLNTLILSDRGEANQLRLSPRQEQTLLRLLLERAAEREDGSATHSGGDTNSIGLAVACGLTGAIVTCAGAIMPSLPSALAGSGLLCIAACAAYISDHRRSS